MTKFIYFGLFSCTLSATPSRGVRYLKQSPWSMLLLNPGRHGISVTVDKYFNINIDPISSRNYKQDIQLYYVRIEAIGLNIRLVRHVKLLYVSVPNPPT